MHPFMETAGRLQFASSLELEFMPKTKSCATVMLCKLISAIIIYWLWVRFYFESCLTMKPDISMLRRLLRLY